MVDLSSQSEVEMKESWLPLTDYSTKYKVSISTLRRRIKCDKINFRFEDGKYFIMDSPLGDHDIEAAGAMPLATATSAPAGNKILEGVPAAVATHPKELAQTVNHLMEELKKAYRLVLQEKEGQILQLREEITDLRTLTRVLESENERINALISKEGVQTDPLF